MRTVNMREAKTNQSRLVDRAAAGESFIIEIKRIGFLEGHLKVPDDFDTMCAGEIEEMFYGKK